MPSLQDKINEFYSYQSKLDFTPLNVTTQFEKIEKIYQDEIDKLESLNNLLKFQVEVLEHNIDLLDSNYRTLMETFDTKNVHLLRLPDSLKPTIDFPEFKVIAADEGQDLGSKGIKLSEISNQNAKSLKNQNLNDPNL